MDACKKMLRILILLGPREIWFLYNSELCYMKSKGRHSVLKVVSLATLMYMMYAR